MTAYHRLFTSLALLVLLVGAVACPIGTAPTPTPAPTATPSPTATPTPTPDPYAGLYIDDLRARSYGVTGTIEVVDTLGDFAGFTRYLIRYPSDGLRINGFMNVPKGVGPFPVVVVVHGYIPPTTYKTVAYTSMYADYIASSGYLVLHPDLRGHGTSEGSSQPAFRVGYAIDVLNLIALAKKLPNARTDGGIGIMGHSMGGGVTGRVMVVSPDVKAAVLYAAVSLDEARTDRFPSSGTPGPTRTPPAGTPGPTRTPVPPEVAERISPINYIRYLSGPVGIHHGEADRDVSPQNSVRVVERLQAEGRAYEYFTYPDQPHTLWGDAHTLFNRRVVALFDRTIKRPPG